MVANSDDFINRKTIFQVVVQESKPKITYVNNKFKELLGLKILNEGDFQTELNGADKKMFTIKNLEKKEQSSKFGEMK